ncbi:MAG: TolC family protein [Cyclobacteriaceae bacterium]
MRYFLFLLVLVTSQAYSQDVRVGIVSDFEKGPAIDSMFQAIISELDRTAGYGINILHIEDEISFNNKTLSQAQSSYRKLSPEVDLILLFGSVSTKGALGVGSFSKPTIGLGIVDPGLQDLPFVNGKSGLKNFSYIWGSKDFGKELLEFRRLTSFNNLAILVNEASTVTFNDQKGKALIDSLGGAFSSTISIVPISKDVQKSLSGLSQDADAVYLSELNGRTSADIKQIADELKRKKLPSFSGTQSHVNNGVLGSISNDNDFGQVIKRLSLMVDGALSGEPLSEMPVAINFKETFNLNLQTAKEIDLYPSFDVLFTANFVGQSESNLPTYSLDQIMIKALENNFDIQLTNLDIALAEQDVVAAQSSVLPDLGLSISGSQANPNSGNNFSPERQALAQLSLTQVLFSEEAIAAIKISRLVKKAQEYQTEANVLNVLLDTYMGYFTVLSAKTDRVIQRDNLRNSQTNLEIAKTKASIGAASKADVYRWESEVANAKQALVRAETAVSSAKLQLNTFLTNVLEDEFDIEDVTIDDEVYTSLRDDPVSKLVNGPRDFKRVSDFMVMESLQSNPNKLFLLENLKTAERLKLQNSRLLYTPVVALQAQGGRTLYRGGQGSEAPQGFEFVDYPWQVGISLSYPIFQGNFRKANLQKSVIQLEQLNYSNTQLDQSLELLVRTNLLETLNATTNIEFSKVASENAQSNFDLVKDNYKQGTVTITQLIDAQRAALQARLNYSLSIYQYVQAQLQVEFSLGFFTRIASKDQIDGFEERFIQFMSDN